MISTDIRKKKSKDEAHEKAAPVKARGKPVCFTFPNLLLKDMQSLSDSCTDARSF